MQIIEWTFCKYSYYQNKTTLIRRILYIFNKIAHWADQLFKFEMNIIQINGSMAISFVLGEIKIKI